jgi:hypothetical protein
LPRCLRHLDGACLRNIMSLKRHRVRTSFCRLCPEPRRRLLWDGF